MRILLAGDTHGSNKAILRAITEAGNRKIQHVVVLGDFGLWTHVADGHDFLDTANEYARVNNLTVYAIGGNHENWDHWNWFVENMPTHKGFAMARRRVLLAPKAHHWVWDHKQFVSAGGAVSIDREWRLAKERGGTHMNSYGFMEDNGRGSGPKTLYWPNEQLTDEDVNTIKSWNLKADYLLTHDCSNFTPFYDRLKPDADSEIHRRRIDEVIAATQAKMQFHGHMHNKFDWQNSQSHGFYSPKEPGAIVTQTYGLECNNDFDAWGVLDTETNQFAFRGQGMNFRSLDEDGYVLSKSSSRIS